MEWVGEHDRMYQASKGIFDYKLLYLLKDTWISDKYVIYLFIYILYIYLYYILYIMYI